MDRLLPAFASEMEKIAVNVGLSAFRQNRKGRRPVRVQTVLDREKDHDKEDETADEAKDVEAEGGAGFSDENEG